MVGDIVIAPFMYTDLSAAKIRPTLVLADVEMGDWILCEITSREQSRPGDIRITQADMRSGRLLRDSWVRPNRLQTLSQSQFIRRVGRVSDGKADEVIAAAAGALLRHLSGSTPPAL